MDRRKLLGLAAAGSAAVLIPSLAACAKGQQAGPATALANAPAGDDVAATGGDTPVPAAVDPVQAAGESPVEPVGGAGLFDVDPDQGAVSQDPNLAVTGDISVMPEDCEF